MLRSEWDALFEELIANRATITDWNPTEPEPLAKRCENSRHRTLAHFRACQEQWLPVVHAFLAKENPNVNILHPGRKFDQGGYAELAWKDHLDAFLADREPWLELKERADWSRGGKMNRNPQTVGSLVQRLAQHETYHLNLFK